MSIGGINPSFSLLNCKYWLEQRWRRAVTTFQHTGVMELELNEKWMKTRGKSSSTSTSLVSLWWIEQLFSFRFYKSSWFIHPSLEKRVFSSAVCQRPYSVRSQDGPSGGENIHAYTAGLIYFFFNCVVSRATWNDRVGFPPYLRFSVKFQSIKNDVKEIHSQKSPWREGMKMRNGV